MRASLLVLVLVLACAAPAYAGSTNSSITTPSGTTFLMDDGNTNLLVAGHADFNNIDIICTYGPDDTPVDVSSAPAYHNIQQQTGTGGDFSAQLPLKPLDYQGCVLHAVPSGSTDPDLSTLTGPTISVGYRHVYADPAPYDYELDLAPLGGYAQFGQSSDLGGIGSTYAVNPTDLSYVTLFVDADELSSPPAVDSGRAAIQVDGQDAYFRHDVRAFADSSPGSPSPTFNFDSTNGTGGVSSQELLGVCVPGGGFPANHTTCHDVVADGVRLDHSADMTDNGALSLVNEQFTSTDGAAHGVDVWFQQEAANVTGNDWQFPGDPGFSDYSGVVGKAVPSGPATALLREPGPAYGSVSWSDAPVDVVRFTNRATFFMHYRFTVPAGGSHVLHFAYGSSFTPDGAAALGAEALAKWHPPVSPGGGGGGGGGSPTPPTLRAKLGSVKRGGDGTVTLLVNAPGAGNLLASETAVVPKSAVKKRTRKLTVSSVRRKVGTAGTVKLVLKLNRKGKKLLRSKHKLPVTLVVTYKPTAGSGNKLTEHLTLKLKKQRKR